MRGIGQMYSEGFFDLTYNDLGCVINGAEFIIETSVNGVIKQYFFFNNIGYWLIRVFKFVYNKNVVNLKNLFLFIKKMYKI